MSDYTATQVRRDTAANWASNNPVPLAGQRCFETDTRKSKTGDGSTAYNSLSYEVAVLADGDYGDVTVSSSGTAIAIDNDAVTYAKIQNVSAASKLLGRGAGSGSGDPQEITLGTNLSMSGTTLNASGGGGSLSDGDYGDITVSSSGAVWTIDNDVVTYAKMQNVSATDKLLGRSTAGAGDVEEITCTSFGRSLIDDTDAATARTTIGVVIGTNVQAYDAELAAIAGLTSAADSFPYFTGSGTAALLVIGSAVRTFLATPSSANLASALTDETGSGKVVFSTAPTFDSTITVGTASGTTGAVLLNGTTSGTVTFKVADAAGTHTIKLPTTTGSADNVLKTDGSGQWGWVGISQAKVRQISVVFDGQGSALTVGTKAYLSCPFAGTITKARILADQSGSCVVDIWKDTYANYPPTIADTITASAKPTLSSAQKNEDSTLTGWTTSVSAGDTFVFNVDSATTVTRVTVTLEITTST